MKIALNGYFLRHPFTGTGAYLQNLVQALRAQPGLDIALYVPADRTTVPRELCACLRPVPCSPRLPEEARKCLFEFLLFPLAALADGCQILHTPYFAPPAIGLAQAVVTVHDVIPLLLPQYRVSPLVAAYGLVVSALAPRAALLLADSAWTKREAVQLLGIPPSRVQVVPLAAAAECTGPNAVQCQQLEELAPYILYLGGYDRRKRVDVLLQAYAQLAEGSAQPPKLVLAGELPRRQSPVFVDPRQLAARLGISKKVAFLGPVPPSQKAALYRNALLFVHPSEYEGFGLTLLEAMACGVPVIAARAPAAAELCVDAALLVRPGDSNAMAQALRQALSDAALRQELARRGLSRAAAFSWERVAAETIAAYRAVWAGSRKKEGRAESAHSALPGS